MRKAFSKSKGFAAAAAAVVSALLDSGCGSSHHSSSSATAAGKVRQYSGTGRTKLGTVTIPAGDGVAVTCQQCSSLDVTSDTNNDGNDLSVSEDASDPLSELHSQGVPGGVTQVGAGGYDNVVVNPHGPNK